MSQNYKLAIVAIARLENAYLKEWVEYHLALGVSHIYVYDNSCGDEERITYQNDNLTVVPAYDKIRFQNQAYTEAYNTYNKLYDFMSFIDIDEFIKLNIKGMSIHDFLNMIPKRVECLRLNWQCYTDGGMITRDMSVKVMDAFTEKTSRHNHQSKSIVRSHLKDITFTSPHYPVIRKYYQLITYDAQFTDITFHLQIRSKNSNHGCLNIPWIRYDFIQLNHYRTKTLDEYMRTKLSRDDATRENYVRKISDEFFKYNVRTPEKIKYYNEHKNEYVKNLNSIESLEEN